MAQRGIQMDQEKLCCSICLDLLKDPVTIPCGHNYCMSCIKSHWDEEVRKEIYSCPQCRQTFRTRPALGRNTMLADLVEELKKTGLQPSCLQCLVSYCEQHLQPHYESPAFKKHKLVDPSKKLQENIRQRIQNREKEVKLLQQEAEAINHSADEAVEDSEKIFTDLICLIEKRSSDVTQQIRCRQKTKVSRVKELQEKLQQEIIDLRQEYTELEQLSHTEEHTQFLHNYRSLSNLTDSKESPSINIRPVQYFKDVTAAVSEVRDKLQDILSDVWIKISLTETEVDVLLTGSNLESFKKLQFQWNRFFNWLTFGKFAFNTIIGSKIEQDELELESELLKPKLCPTLNKASQLSPVSQTLWAGLGHGVFVGIKNNKNPN
uniref:RING-type domain-containing protein n=1 Tax=Sander lucioperca TaxID=283035 RepID=A0A8C9XT82_SANLU